MATEQITLPGATDRTAVVGRTGSGKTFAAVWLLSRSDFEVRPWVVIDYKNDSLINAIERAELIGLDTIPEEPGIYILKVLPGEDEEERLSEWLHRVWERESIGIYVDEGYMIGQRDKWFNACLTQGRSKQISMIVLSQRPVWLSRFVFSEADYFIVFELTHDRDRDAVQAYVASSERERMEAPLEPYHFWFYDVAGKRLTGMRPVPDGAELLAAIDERLAAMQAVEEPVARMRAI
jgi:hypothetical protein